jgi:hypothetical protein
MKERLERAADQLGISKHSLANLCIEAGIGAIEKNDGNLVLPVEFTVTRVAVPQSGSRTSYPSHRPREQSLVEDNPAKPPKKRRAA